VTKPLRVQAPCPKDKIQKYKKMWETMGNTQQKISESSSQGEAKVTTSEHYDRQGGNSRKRLHLAVNEKFM
jgi:hypothetical protein